MEAWIKFIIFGVIAFVFLYWGIKRIFNKWVYDVLARYLSL